MRTDGAIEVRGALNPISQALPEMPYQMVIVSARVIQDETGADAFIPVILTPKGVVLSLLKYFLAHAHKSLSWMEQTARVVIRFQDYVNANGLPGGDWAALFDLFAAQRLNGTISTASQLDPSGLGWEGVGESHAASERLQLIAFFKWAAKKLVESGKAQPSQFASIPDHVLSRAAMAYRRESDLLGHLWDVKRDGAPRQAVPGDEKAGRQANTTGNPPKAFPEHKFWSLVFEGFNAADVLELQAMLYVLLMNCGGLRSSEPPHLWVHDVYPDPDNPETAVVRIYHPSNGAAPDDTTSNATRMTRRAYLRKHYGISPRHGLQKAQRAGWKGGFLDDAKQGYKEVRWFPTYAGEVFLQLWNAYIPNRALLPDRSPFAFVSFEGQKAGFGFNRKSLQERYAKACAQVGLKATTEDGTNPHGHRHAYGKRLKAADVSREITRRAMHHKSADSQDTYTAPTSQEIAATLAKHAQRLKESSAEFHQKYGAKLDEVVARAERASPKS